MRGRLILAVRIFRPALAMTHAIAGVEPINWTLPTSLHIYRGPQWLVSASDPKISFPNVTLTRNAPADSSGTSANIVVAARTLAERATINALCVTVKIVQITFTFTAECRVT
jgi:hypothetical protein